MTKNRNFKVKDLEMLLASKTIMGKFRENLTDLSFVRINWTDIYAEQLSYKIDDAIENYLGLDQKKELREATGILAKIQTPALRDISFLKTQLAVDFGREAKSMIKNLGLDNKLTKARYGNQESLIQLLYALKKGLTPEVIKQIVGKGTHPELLKRIIGYADELLKASISQETLMENSQEITGEAITTFNEIYEEVTGICRIAVRFYQYELLKKEQFNFNRIAAGINAARSILANRGLVPGC
ncbi:MAG: hypothetical protein JXB49_03950 [Bacteroidales bacterium]|nr:hypothetical protein [Bacteroidales bacterium]